MGQKRMKNKTLNQTEPSTDTNSNKKVNWEKKGDNKKNYSKNGDLKKSTTRIRNTMNFKKSNNGDRRKMTPRFCNR
jgi:hypothetical protein